MPQNQIYEGTLAEATCSPSTRPCIHCHPHSNAPKLNELRKISNSVLLFLILGLISVPIPAPTDEHVEFKSVLDGRHLSSMTGFCPQWCVFRLQAFELMMVFVVRGRNVHRDQPLNKSSGAISSRVNTYKGSGFNRIYLSIMHE